MTERASNSVARSVPAISALAARLDLGELRTALRSGAFVNAPISAASIAIAVTAAKSTATNEFDFPLIVALTPNNGEELFEELKELLPDQRVLRFPHWETLPHERLSPQSDTIGCRQRTTYPWI